MRAETLDTQAETRIQPSDGVEILGVPVHDVTREDVEAYCRRWLLQHPPALHHIVTVNPEFIMAARSDSEFREILRQADIATADGIGVMLAARLLGKPLRERVTGVDLTEMLAWLISPSPRLFLLGAAPGTADNAAARLVGRNPSLTITGTCSGSPADSQAGQIIQQIHASGANVLLVAFGHPAQDKWIARHRRALAECGIVITIGVGGTFDYLAGTVPRAPSVIRRAGLEWLYRLIRQPWRWRRQLALPRFALLVLRERFFRKGKVSVKKHGDTNH